MLLTSYVLLVMYTATSTAVDVEKIFRCHLLVLFFAAN
jgi:hypothetical protein